MYLYFVRYLYFRAWPYNIANLDKNDELLFHLVKWNSNLLFPAPFPTLVPVLVSTNVSLLFEPAAICLSLFKLEDINTNSCGNLVFIILYRLFAILLKQK